ncbi:LysR family transcriptional regulator [Ramlibacter rhizophilus]|uniref:LysR family transcriptional regulator n=1 Tax=Ramlibacter rhizophilus TaxID=1781167 RepID=A0A4Z0BPE5_9BURK|nr:LysR family transcriptional regulator [Ramlibacter rhizophilus]TFY99838.1 LysR family transcriptional regulator [Ramlibacter rhizophilus]
MNVTLRQLQAFGLVARHGSFTQAAQAMHLTQSALSLLLRELEAALDTRLVNRTTRSVTLTDVGAEFLEMTQRVLGDLEHAVTHVGELIAKQRGRVVIAAPLVLAGTFLPPLLASFRARFPGIELVLKDSLPDEVLPHVRSGAADLGIGTFPRVQDGLEQVLLFRESLVAVFPRTHALARTRGTATVKWRQLAGEPVLTLPRGSVFRDLAEAGFAAAGLPLAPALEATYVGTLIGLVKAGLGVAVVPGYATALADPQVVAWRRLSGPDIQREVVMVHRRDRTLSPAAQALHGFLLESNAGGDGKPRKSHPRLNRAGHPAGVA